MKLFISYDDQIFPVEFHELLKLDAVLHVFFTSIGRPNEELSKYVVERNGVAIDMRADSTKNLTELGFEDDQILSLRDVVSTTTVDGKPPVELSDHKLTNLIRSIIYSKKRNDQQFQVVSSKTAFEIFKNFHILPLQRRNSLPVLNQVHTTHPGDFGAFYLVYLNNLPNHLVNRNKAETLPGKEERIEAAKREKILNDNLKDALEEIPEGFFRVEMLYIGCTINGHPVKILVDTGGQMSIMSESVARRVGLFHLIDPRFRGRAAGVGGLTQTLGQICKCSLLVEGHEISANFMVLPDQGANTKLILGLDLMIRHRAKIDMFARTITFDDTITTHFLKPDDAKKVNNGEDQVVEANEDNQKMDTQ